jgi:hypothetical protein
VFIARAKCVIECNSRRLVLQLQSAEVSRTVMGSFAWSWTIGVDVKWRDPRSRELNSIQFICINIIHCLCTINSITLDVGIIANVCGLPNSPFLTEVRAPSLLEQHPLYFHHRDSAGYNKQVAWSATFSFSVSLFSSALIMNNSTAKVKTVANFLFPNRCEPKIVDE